MTGRALVLAGGGIRVAWQTGVVAALYEAGLTFDHGDGTSGGIFTLGMLMSGQRPDEMVERWERLDVRSFVSTLPLRSYLRSPTSWPAFGGASGVRDRALPGLGIDLDRIHRCTTMTGTFNVADFTRKRCVPVPHSEIDLDRLIAGVSLAAVMPAVQQGGRWWTDAVWIQDANLMEAVRRGCTELWVLWCIGNTPRWGAGALEQYVHMIELSATGALNAELDAIAELNRRRAAGEPVHGSTQPVVVHVVHPALPLPLDPELVAGRIDAATLIAMGYRDGCRYLASGPSGADGTPLDETATQTPARELGARMVLRGTGDGPVREYALVVEADDLAALRACPGMPVPAVGHVEHATLGRRLLASGRAALVDDGGVPSLAVTADLGQRGAVFRLTVPLRRPRQHQWSLTGTTGHHEEGAGRMSLRQAAAAVVSLEPTGAHGLRDRARAVTDVARLALHRGVRLAHAPADPPTDPPTDRLEPSPSPSQRGSTP